MKLTPNAVLKNNKIDRKTKEFPCFLISIRSKSFANHALSQRGQRDAPFSREICRRQTF
jgi:hypothetical protein